MGDDGRSSSVESWLDGLSVEWEFIPDLDLDLVDVKASRANQARLEVLDDGVVERYEADMVQGDRFPPVLVHSRSKRSSKVVLLGGNHRHEAATRAGLTTLPAYRVWCEPEMATRLMYEDNRRHGFPPSDEERIRQAIHLIDQGWTQEAAAHCVGVTSAKVSRARGVIEANRRAKRLGIPPRFEGLPKTTRSRLQALRSDPVFVEASKLTLNAQLGSEEVYSLVTRLNEATSDEAALGVVGVEEETLRGRIEGSAGGKRTQQTETQRLELTLSRLIDVDADKVAVTVHPDRVKALNQRCVAGARRLMEISEALK